MRKNAFGEAYCHTAAEARHYIDEHSDGDVYVGSIDPPEGEFKATAEVVSNDDGETICHIEADSVEMVRAIVMDAGIEITL